MWLKAIGAWLAIAVLAVGNGGVRESLIVPRFGELTGHVLSTVVLCIVIFVVSRLTISWLDPSTIRQSLAIGAFWVALTLAFEFLAGHFLFGHSWQRLISDYDLARGRVWVLVLLATLVAPVWAQRTRLKISLADGSE